MVQLKRGPVRFQLGQGHAHDRTRSMQRKVIRLDTVAQIGFDGLRHSTVLLEFGRLIGPSERLGVRLQGVVGG